MELFWRAAAAVLITVILSLCLERYEKAAAVMLTLFTVSLVAILAVSYLEPVMTFAKKLCTVGQLDENMLEILLKAVGIGLIGEISSLVCSDSGHAVLGKVLQILCTAVILWLSLPLFEQTLDLLQEVLEGL
jgi:stage III sporulation protein AD